MPSFPTDNFSYEASAKALRYGDVPVLDKLAACDRLLALAGTLSPSPYTLVLNHILFVLKPKPPSTAFTEHLPAYWNLLARTLKESKTDIHSLQAHPNNLLPAATAHLACSDTAVVQPVADALLYLASSTTARPLSQSIELHASLLATVVSLVHKHPGLHPLAVWTLDAHSRLQQRSRDPRDVLSVAVKKLLFPLLCAPSNLRTAAEPLLATAIFGAPTLSRQPLLRHIRESNDPFLPEAVEFLFRACVRVARSAEINSEGRSSKGRKRSAASQGSLAQDVLRVLQFFDELVVTLGDSLQDATKSDILQSRSALALKVVALAKVFEVAKEVDAYRPSYDVLAAHAPSKRSRTSGKAGDDVKASSDKSTEHQSHRVHIGSRVRKLFMKLVTLLGSLYRDSESSGEVVEAVSLALQSILAFSLDAVEDTVPDLLMVIVQGRDAKKQEDVEYSLLPSRQGIFCALVKSHHETRLLPLLFKRLTSSSMGFRLLSGLSNLLCDDEMKRTLAEAIESLPLGQPQQCIEALMSNEGRLSSNSVPCTFFLISLIMEAANTTEFRGVWESVQKNVIPRVPGMKRLASIRSASLSLLSSHIFSLARMDAALLSTQSTEELSTSDLLIACGVSEQICQDPSFTVAEKLYRTFSQNKQKEDVTELVCVIRALAMSCHWVVARTPNEKDKELLKKMIFLVFDYFAQLVPNKASYHFWEGASLFHERLPRDVTVSFVTSLVPLLDFCGSSDEVPQGFASFLGYVAQKFNGLDQFWEDLLECSVVHRVLGDSLRTWLSAFANRTDTRTPTCQSSGCHISKVLRLLQSLPASFLSVKDEEGIGKTVAELEMSLCCQEAKGEAFETMLRLRGASFGSNASMVLSMATQHISDHILKLIGEKVLNGALNEEEGMKLVKSVIDIWMKKGSPTVRPYRVRNCSTALACVGVVNAMGEGTLNRMIGYILSVQRECEAVLEGNGRTNGDLAKVLEVAEAVLRLRSGGNEWKSLEGSKKKVVRQGSEHMDTFLKKIFEESVAFAMRMVTRNGSSEEDEEFRRTGRSFLVSLCEGKRVGYRVCQAGGEGWFAMGRVSAVALHLLRSTSGAGRSAGVEMLCGIGSNESDENVEQLGKAIYEELKSWGNLWQDDASKSVSDGRETKMVKLFEVMRGRILAGGCMTCGWETDAEGCAVNWGGCSKEFAGFREARRRRDLGSLRVEGEMTGLVLCEMLKCVGVLVDEIQKLEGLPTRVQRMYAEELKQMRQVTRECISVSMDSAEIAGRRKGGDRVDGQEVMTLVCGLGPWVGVADEDGSGIGEYTRGQMGRICTGLVHNQSCTRWPGARLLRSVLHGEGLSSRSGRAVGEGYGELGECGRREVVRAALGDVCARLAVVGTGAVRREMMGGIGKLLKGAGEAGVVAVGLGLGAGAREVLRGVREMYAGDGQYRGK